MPDKETSLPNYVIGGPARCGKSTLASYIAQHSSTHAALRVDALLYKYLKMPALSKQEDIKAFAKEYLLRPRYMNPEKTLTSRPLDDFKHQDISLIVSQLNITGIAHPLTIISRLLDLMAKDNGKKNWVILDLHAEFYFKKYIRYIEHINLIMLTRPPVEAITASLYWRTFPQRLENSTAQLRYKLWLFCISSLYVKYLFKKDNRLTIHHCTLAKDLIKHNPWLVECFAIPIKEHRSSKHPQLKHSIFFDYKHAEGFYTPANTRMSLLARDEIVYIERFYHDSNFYKQRCSGLTRLLFFIGERWPLKLKFLFELYFFRKQKIAVLKNKLISYARKQFQL